MKKGDGGRLTCMVHEFLHGDEEMNEETEKNVVNLY